jgi:hypothetical protein
MTPIPSPAHGGIAEQLEPLRARMRTTRPSVLAVSQTTLVLSPGDPLQGFQNSVQVILRWIAGRAGRRLPDQAWKGESFDLEEVGAQRVSAVALADPRYWAARLDDSDKNVPQRVWTTETSLGQSPEGGILFGARLTCVTRGESPPYERSLPGFVRQLIDLGYASLDGRRLNLAPWFIDSDAQVDSLLSLLRNRHRRADVIVFALPEQSEDPAQTLANADFVHQRTLGAAHVAIIGSAASFTLSDRVGKEFSVFRQAVRTYRAGFDEIRDQPFSHPLALPERIARWSPDGASTFEGFLVQQALANSVLGGDLEDRVPSFSTVRQAASRQNREAARAAGTDDKELLALALEENADLVKDLAAQKDDFEGLLSLAERDVRDARQEKAEMAALVSSLKARIGALEHRISTATGRVVEVPIPTSLENLEGWSRENLAGAVVLHNRAFQGAKKSEYNDPSLVYKALLVLRDQYVEMRRFGGAERKQSYAAALESLGLEESNTLAGANYEGDTYEVQYGGRPRLLESHLKRGNSREPRFCFRLYFFWDDDTEQVVVGWLPSHLQNRMS